MNYLRSFVLSLLVLFVPSSALFAQRPVPPPPMPPPREVQRPTLEPTAVIKQLLEADPLAPEAADGPGRAQDSASTGQAKPPADDAPLKQLIDYWTRQRWMARATEKPSDAVRLRLLQAVEARPHLFSRLEQLLPETTETYDRLYKLLTETKQPNREWSEPMRAWLRERSGYFREELKAAAEAAAKGAFFGPGTAGLETLARLDWDAARPLAERASASKEPAVSVAALSLLYEHAGDDAQRANYRAQLQAVVANKDVNEERNSEYARQRALQSLMTSEWQGQREWLTNLLADPATNGVAEAEPEPAPPASKKRIGIIPSRSDNLLLRSLISQGDRWLPILRELVGNPNRAVHIAAVKYLTQLLANAQFLASENKLDKAVQREAALQLLPILTDENWALPETRSAYLRVVGFLQLREATGALITMVSAEERGENLIPIVQALLAVADASTAAGAAPALRRALQQEPSQTTRDLLVKALATLNAFGDDELVTAFEAHARMALAPGGAERLQRATYEPKEKLPLPVSIGKSLVANSSFTPSESLAAKLIERAGQLRKTEPDVAAQMLRWLQGQPLPIVSIDLIERMGGGWIDLEGVTLALAERERIAKEAGRELNALTKLPGYPMGLAAVLLKDEARQREILSGADAKARTALLAAARFRRDSLPFEQVAKLLSSPDKQLAQAAESYLEMEDSRAARQLLWARHPGEAKILGYQKARSEGPDTFGAAIDEQQLREEAKSASAPDLIYALHSNYGRGGAIIRVRGNQAELSLYQMPGRRRVRVLTASEFTALRALTARDEIEDLGPETYQPTPYFYLRLQKDGGRRIALAEWNATPRAEATLHEELAGFFYELAHSGEFKVRYDIEDKVPGVEVIIAADDDLGIKRRVVLVCGEGRQIRALQFPEQEPSSPAELFTSLQWREVNADGLGRVADEPRACPMTEVFKTMIDLGPRALAGVEGGVKIYDDFFLFTKIDEGHELWKKPFGRDAEKLLDEAYASPVITLDGRWLIGVRRTTDEQPLQLVRRDLQSGKEFTIEAPLKGAMIWPVDYLAAHGKVLLSGEGRGRQANAKGQGWLLDPATGALQAVTGEFGPLLEQRFRRLQPTENADEFWASRSNVRGDGTIIGRYNTRTFTFTKTLELPELYLDGQEFWVQSEAGKVWIVSRGDLLRVSLPR